MTITIKLHTDNVAFEHDRDQEVLRILKRIAAEWYSFGSIPIKLRDINGNTVGSVTVQGE